MITLVAINARYSHSNLAVRCLRHALKEQGIKRDIIEKSINDDMKTVLPILYEKKSKYYGFSVYIWNKEYVYALAQDLKKLLPNCKIIFGGPEVSYDAYEVIKLDFVDYIITGEGEKPICELLKNPDKEINQVVTKQYDNTAFVPNKNLPFVYEKEDFKELENRIVYYESQRGCPFRCSYCLSQNDRIITYKDKDEVIEDIIKLDKNKVKLCKFVDRTFNADKARARYILKRIAQLQLDISLHFEICAHLLEDEDFEIIKGLKNVLFEVGVQSTNFEVLKKINRPLDVEKTLVNIKRLYELGNSNVHVDLICGMCDEDIKSIEKSINQTAKICDDLQLGFLKILKGCKTKEEEDLYGYMYSQRPPYEILKTNALSYEDIIKLKKIERVINKFKNSHFYDNLMEHLLSKYEPYALFEMLYLHFEKHGVLYSNLSKKHECEYLYKFLKTDYEKEFLRLDFHTHNKGSYIFKESEVDKDKKRRFLKDENNIKKYFNNFKINEIDKFSDIYEFNFGEPRVLIFDRKNGIINDITNDFN